MKRICVIMIVGVFFLFTSDTLFSQSSGGEFLPTIIEPYPLKITLNKTTNLIFQYAIKSVDRGSADVLAQKAKGVENILLVKAGRENFPQTNLSVITADGKLYSFVLDYVSNPSVINLSFTNGMHVGQPHLLKPIYNEAEIQIDAERIAGKGKKTHGVTAYNYDVKFTLDGIYIKTDVIFFRVKIANYSNINYDVDMLRFFIKDEKKSKRTASQELQVDPLYVYGDTSTIKGDATNVVVFAVPKFTIPDDKYLLIELMEKNGGRNLQLLVRNRTIIKAKLLF
ncbi:conjugative transposon protein TraN [Segetibacter koreensis]|uniref:conjugative transposon protein TraN n=1 Tax=Segetibacter koreensis TaxID=398037 RepID=UPI0003A055D8|nr:conjugative transposon protein TraN [Segetibacter koreensis]